MPASGRHRGWWYDLANSDLEVYNNSATREMAISNGGGLTVDRGGVTITAGGQTVTAGDVTLAAAGAAFVATSGNAELGNPGAFATTQPQGAVVMGGSSLNGIAPAGAITTAGAIFASDTVVRKIIAAGTVSNVET